MYKRQDRALHEVVNRADLFAFLLKNADEFLADDLALGLRIGHARQLAEETRFRVHADEVDVPLAERGLDLVALVLAHQAVVDEYAGELAADRLGQQGRCDRRIHAAGQRQQHLAVAHLAADGGDRVVLIVAHRPVALGAADLIEEVAQHKRAVFRVVDLRVELHTVKTARLVRDRGGRAHGGVRGERKARRDLGHIVAVAHPRDALCGQTLEETAAVVIEGLSLAVFAGGVLLRGSDLAA